MMINPYSNKVVNLGSSNGGLNKNGGSKYFQGVGNPLNPLDPYLSNVKALIISLAGPGSFNPCCPGTRFLNHQQYDQSFIQNSSAVLRVLLRLCCPEPTRTTAKEQQCTSSSGQGPHRGREVLVDTKVAIKNLY